MFINDQLLKHDVAVESLLRKVERQYLDITEKTTVDFVIESRDGTANADTYVLNFKWDDSRFARNTPLVELIKALQNVYFPTYSQENKRGGCRPQT
jgi:V-type H+-transporting ATPase subunit C